jgi:hypothetical protein
MPPASLAMACEAPLSMGSPWPKTARWNLSFSSIWGNSFKSFNRCAPFKSFKSFHCFGSSRSFSSAQSKVSM